MSRRNDIKIAVRDVLESTGFSASGSVYLSRVDDLPVNKLPAVMLYFTEVQSEPTDGRDGYVHNENLTIACMVTGPARVDRVATGTSYADEKVDELEDEVRKIMLSPSTRSALGGLIQRLEYRGAKVGPGSGQPEDNVWMSMMTFAVYWTETLA